MTDIEQATAAAVEALRRAASAVDAVSRGPADKLAEAIQLVLAAPGRVAVSGLGKTGLIARKVAATLSSTGTPAWFVHAADALHGDSGAIGAGDVLIAISNSGETPELLAVVALAGERGVPVVSISGCGGSSTLARAATVTLDASVERECDPEDLVPTASTTVALVLGDALAVGLMVARGFASADFAKHHPAGTLGQRLAGS